MARQARQKDAKRAKLARKIKERAEAKKQGAQHHAQWRQRTGEEREMALRFVEHHRRQQQEQQEQQRQQQAQQVATANLRLAKLHRVTSRSGVDGWEAIEARKREAGRTAEAEFAAMEAHGLLPFLRQNPYFWTQLIVPELVIINTRLGDCGQQIPTVFPSDVSELVRSLHVALYADNVGYDVLGLQIMPNAVRCRFTEVKCAMGDTVYLSENERCCALDLLQLNSVWECQIRYHWGAQLFWADVTPKLKKHLLNMPTVEGAVTPNEWQFKLVDVLA